MDLSSRSMTINSSHVRRRSLAGVGNSCRRGGRKQSPSSTTRVILSVAFILIKCSQTTKCLQESTAKSSVEIKHSSPLLQVSVNNDTRQPSQSFTSAPTASDERQQSTANSPANLWRPSIGNERENEFFMSALSSEQFEKNQQQSVQSAVSELPGVTGSTASNEDTTTRDHQLFDTTTTVACPGDQTNPVDAEGNEHSDELIAINATRKQFVTHDQLLTEVEPRQSQTNDSSTYQKIAQSSRAGMSRLASSFGLSDLFSRYARPKTTVPLQHQPDHTTDEQKGATSQQQSQSAASCPGVCLDLLTASLRCRNAISASCPSFFQKCCELDDVSFNGTPVETSAPITGGDSDNNSVSSASDVAQAGEQVPGDQQSAVSATLRPPTTATPTGAPTTPSVSTTSPISGQPSAGLEQRRQQPQLQSSIYFFSSASDDTDGDNNQQQHPGAERQDSSLEHRQQVWPTSANSSVSAVGPTQSSSLAQPAGQQPDNTTNGNQKIPSASQSFDLSLASSSPESTKSKPSLANNRVVVLQTANGTAYLIPTQQARPRPLYANWTDYQLLMTQMRPQQSNGPSSSVVYHSNIDPVRKLTAGDNSTSSTLPVLKQTNDLTEKQLINFNDRATHDNDTLKVLKDQHSSASSLAKQHIDAISSTQPTLPSTPNTTTNQSQLQQTTLATRTENRLEPTAISTTPSQQWHSQTDLVDATTIATETNNQDAQQSPVSGIANVLTSLFDAFMAPSSSTSNGDASDEARAPPNYNSAPDGDLMPLSSFNAQNDQHNDRRLGLDLSFRQQNEHSNSSAADRFQHMSDDGSLMMTSDGANETPSSSLTSSNDPSDGCTGYCALDQYVGVCDSWYPSSACGSAQKCCVTGRIGSASGTEGQGSNGEDQHSAASSSNAGQQSNRPSQVCQGTCLPVYHSSLCTKPNEIQLDSPSCLPNQVCCNHLQEDGQSVDEHQQALRGNGNNVAQPGPQQQSLSSFVSELFSSGSSNKQTANTGDGLFSASLVPPPPPTISSSNQASDHENSKLSGTSLLPRQAAQQQQLLRQQTTIAYQQPTPRPVPPAGAKAIHHQLSSGQPNGGSGGLMNQLFQMFKSNTGLGKQVRPKQQVVPQNFIQQPVYELQSQSYPMLTSGSAPQSQSMLPTQIVFPMLQQQQPIINSMTGAGQILMIPSQMQTAAASNSQAQQMIVQPYAGLSSTQAMSGFDVAGMQQQRNNRFNNPASMLTGLSPQQQQMLPVSKYPQTVDPMHMVLRQQQPQQQFNRQQTATNQFTQEQQQQQQHQQQLFNQVSNYQLVQQQQHVVAQKMNPISRPLQHQTTSDVPNPVPLQHNNLAGTNNFLFNANGFRAQNNNNPPLTQTQSGSSKWTPQQLPHHQQPSEQLPTNAQRQNQPNNSNLASNGLVSSAASNQVTKGYPPTRQMVVDQPTNGRQQWVATSSSNGNGNNAPIPKQQHRIVQNINNDFIRPTIEQQWNRLQPEPDTNVVSLATKTESNHNQLASTRSPILQRPKPSTTHSNPVQANPVQRVSGTPTIVTTTNQPPTIKAANNAQTKQTGATMVSDASNMNVMISSHDDNGAMQQRPGYSYSSLSEQSSAPQVLTTSRSPPLIINNDEEAPIADESDDQGASSPSNLDSIANERPPCRSACLAPMLSFDCVQPNYIDESLACPSIGEVCCIKGASHNSHRQQESSLSPVTPTSIRYSASASPTASVDLNKLDNQPVSPDESSNNEESHLSSGATSDNGTDAHNSFESPTVVVNTLEDDQQTSSNVKQTMHTTSKATACGLPGPARKRGRISSGQARGRVMGGFDSEPGYWCWQAALMNDKNEYLCGGALIGTKWVLTAAHCITQHLRSESQLYVRLGQTNLNNSDVAERKAARSVLVKTSYVHHNHNGVTLDNDIALLRLEDSIDLEVPTICTICLPERAGEGSQRNQLAPGKRCTVTGYGFEHESGPAALRVRQTDLPIVSDSECQNKTSLVLGKPFSLPASSFCAGGELGQDACHGDGGSPLACLVDGFYELTGIVSWGYKCGNKDLPGLYAKVTNFVGWINQIVSVNN